MKPKLFLIPLLLSTALTAQAQNGGHHGGGRGTGGGNPGGRGTSVRGGSFYHSMPVRSYGSRMISSGQRYSSIGMRSAAVRRPYVYSNTSAFSRSRQFTSQNFGSRNISADNRLNQLGNNARGANNFARGNQALGSQRNGTSQIRNGQVRNGNNLAANWRNHVFAQRSADWHRDWDRGRDHWWNGHRCCFINGSWVIFDFGFFPWWPSWWYPYNYYGYGYGYPYGYDYGYGYPSGYDSGYYDSGYYGSGVYQGEQYYGQQPDEYYDRSAEADYSDNGYNSSTRYTDSIVATVQDRLAQSGYYQGQIDGSLGPETRRAIARYQRNHGLRVTGSPTTETLEALGVRQVAGS